MKWEVTKALVGWGYGICIGNGMVAGNRCFVSILFGKWKINLRPGRGWICFFLGCKPSTNDSFRGRNKICERCATFPNGHRVTVVGIKD